jgi:hypothetical protein
MHSVQIQLQSPLTYLSTQLPEPRRRIVLAVCLAYMHDPGQYLAHEIRDQDGGAWLMVACSWVQWHEAAAELVRRSKAY